MELIVIWSNRSGPWASRSPRIGSSARLMDGREPSCTSWSLKRKVISKVRSLTKHHRGLEGVAKLKKWRDRSAASLTTKPTIRASTTGPKAKDLVSLQSDIKSYEYRYIDMGCLQYFTRFEPCRSWRLKSWKTNGICAREKVPDMEGNGGGRLLQFCSRHAPEPIRSKHHKPNRAEA